MRSDRTSSSSIITSTSTSTITSISTSNDSVTSRCMDMDTNMNTVKSQHEQHEIQSRRGFAKYSISTSTSTIT